MFFSSFVRVGEYDTRTDIDCNDFGCAPPYQDLQVAKWIPHENWNTDTVQNDIALIKTKQRAKYHGKQFNLKFLICFGTSFVLLTFFMLFLVNFHFFFITKY